MKSAYDELAEFVGDDFEATNAVRLALAEGTRSALAPEGVQKQAARDFLIAWWRAPRHLLQPTVPHESGGPLLEQIPHRSVPSRSTICCHHRLPATNVAAQ